jgi:hypothetical protein
LSEAASIKDVLDGPSRGLERWGVTWRKILWPQKPRWIVILF